MRLHRTAMLLVPVLLALSLCAPAAPAQVPEDSAAWSTDDLADAAAAPGPASQSGWTDTAPIGHARLVFLSAIGDDANPCTKARPCRTIQRGVSMLRDGHPDQLLFRCGDTWEGQTLGEWLLSGRSATERMVIGSYGQGRRPRIILPVGQNGLTRIRTESTGNLIVVGLHFLPAEGHDFQYDGFQWQGGPDLQPDGGTDILIEDCRFTRLFRGVNIQGATRVQVRRCVFEDLGSVLAGPYSPASIYIGLCSDVTIEENVIVNRFFTMGIRPPYVQDSAVYLQDDNVGKLHCRRNTIVYKGEYGPVGIQMRCPGALDDNVIYGCHTAIDLGQVSSGHYAPTGIHGRASGNVILHGVNLDRLSDRAIGILVSNTDWFTVADNVVAAKATVSGGTGIDIDPGNRGPVRSLLLQSNLVYDWSGIQVQQGLFYASHLRVQDNAVQNPLPPGSENPLVQLYDRSIGAGGAFSENTYASLREDGTWFVLDWNPMSNGNWSDLEPTAVFRSVTYPAPARDLATYAQTLGMAKSLDAAITALAKQSRQSWDESWTTEAIRTYLRDGFGR